MRWVPPAHSPLRWSDLTRALASDGRSQVHAQEALQRRFNTDAVLLCDSGTTALTLALQIGAQSHPGAVAVPGYVCFDIATAISVSDDRVIVYDIDPHTLNPDLESLARALRAGARRVVVAPLYGVPLDWSALRAMCDAAGALLIEDAAQGSGASWRGIPHGALGDLAVLSFGRGKGRTTGGGGALLARDSAMGAGVAELSQALQRTTASRLGIIARLTAQLAFSSPTRFGWIASVPGLQIGETTLQSAHPPQAMANAQAAMVEFALDREAAEVAVRRETAEYWMAELPSALEVPRVVDDARAGYLRFPVLWNRATHLGRAQRRLGVGAAYPCVLSDLPIVAERSSADARDPLPGARVLVERLLTLPTHSLLAPRDRDAITRWLAAQG